MAPFTVSQKPDITNTDPTSALLPGSCALRLTNLHKYTPSAKKRLMQSIATDIKATLICIANQARVGNLTARQTAPVNEVIRIIRDTDVAERRRLENRVARHRRQARQWKVQRQKIHGIQGQLSQIVESVDKVIEAWKKRLDHAEEKLERAMWDLKGTRIERDMLKQKVKKGKGMRRRSVDDTSA